MCFKGLEPRANFRELEIQAFAKFYAGQYKKLKTDELKAIAKVITLELEDRGEL